ncbi:MAG: cellulase family glycosylhydrolase [Anaerolineae bacterium]|nr:cellulase family glycosylhydrolase [Anaerolineae bacterium]MDW7991744.1 cellulase family glycosylhydrolase [Anaerolineae bacterium]
MNTRLLCLLVLGILLVSCVASPSDSLFRLTGEEDALRQAYALIQLAGNPFHTPPSTRPYEPVAYAGFHPFGMNVFLEQEVELWKREKTLQMIADAGFHWIRQSFPWEDIEIHGKGDFEDRRHKPYRSAWEKYDHIVALAEEHGLEVIAVLNNPPAWSRADGDARGSFAPPDNLEDYGDFAYAVASRYRGRVRAYQVWNEPNIYPEWGEQPVDPEAYTHLLCVAYRRIKEADPDAIVLTGALAQTVGYDFGPGPWTGMNEFVFLQRMYKAGAANCFDVLAVNDYILWSAPTDRRLRPWAVTFARPVYLRDLMVANGDAHKPIWLTEMNANAVPNDPSIQAWGAYGQVTLEQQARYAPLAYERILRDWPWVGVVNFWFFRRPSDEEKNQAWYYFRMVEPNFTPLPVYHAMRDYIANLTPTLYPGTHQEDDWALEYTGDWEFVRDSSAVLGGYRRTSEPGASVAFVFEGRALTLTPGPVWGEIEVQIDDGTPRWTKVAGEPVRLFSSLRRETHRVRVTLVRGQFGVDSVTVRGE